MSTGSAMSAKYRNLHPEFADLWDEDFECWTVGELADGHVVQVMPLLFTAAVVVTRRGSFGYIDRWCYSSVESAFAAARVWTGPYPDTEPTGWHRHPTSGRRRDDGDPASEYVSA